MKEKVKKMSIEKNTAANRELKIKWFIKSNGLNVLKINHKTTYQFRLFWCHKFIDGKSKLTNVLKVLTHANSHNRK